LIEGDEEFMKLAHFLNIKCYGTRDQKKKVMDYDVWQCLDGVQVT